MPVGISVRGEPPAVRRVTARHPEPEPEPERDGGDELGEGLLVLGRDGASVSHFVRETLSFGVPGLSLLCAHRW